MDKAEAGQITRMQRGREFHDNAVNGIRGAVLDNLQKDTIEIEVEVGNVVGHASSQAQDLAP